MIRARIHVPIWYVPSFYGDITLTADGEDRTVLFAEKLTEHERRVLRGLHPTIVDKFWLTDGLTETEALGRMLMGGTVRLNAPIAEVSKLLADALKPGRAQVSVVKFTDGTMEEVSTAALAESEKSKDIVKEAAAATTVAAPTRGCPAPSHSPAEIKARAVLAAFLQPEQMVDFRQTNRFISIGASGTRYMITSRHAKDALARYHRSLYNLDEEMPLCVHDWSVPAAEEMLGLHVLLQIPRWERYVNVLEGVDSDYDAELAMAGMFS